MVDPLLGLLSFLCRSLLLVSAYGYMTPPVPFPSSLEKLVPNPSGEVVYQKSSVYGVVDRAVILDCGPATLLPDIYIWSFTKPGSQEIKNVVYDLGKGHRMQALARTLGQVTVISNTASLSIEQLALAAHGVFTCQAIYDTATEARFYYYYVYLTVRVPISKPYLEVSESSPVEGNTVRMRCNLENGTGPIQYEWHHENMNGSVTIFGQGNSSVVDVNNINRNNTGWYRCQAQNPVNSEQSDRTWLSIIFGPDVPQIDVTPYTMTERGYSALERETVSLMCQAQSNPPSQYVWLYNNSQVFGGPQYTITKILRMHTGDYTCLAQNTYLNTRSKKSISLTVYFGPDLPQIVATSNTRTESGYTVIEKYAAIEKDNVSLLCQTQSNPPSEYIWIYNNSQISSRPELTISRVLRAQTGDYICLAQNALLNSSSTTNISLSVYYPPEGQPTCSMEAVSNHSSLRLVCLWAGGYPTPKLSWSSDFNLTQQEKTDKQLVKNKAIYVASDNNTLNNSSFTCRGTHPAVTQPAECSVHTYVSDEDLQCFFSVNGLNVTLSCLWEGGVPRALVWWDGPGGHSKPGQEGSNNMTIRYGTLRTEMPYTCHARHPLLTLSKTCNITLVAVSRPSLLLSEASPLEGSSISMICKVQNGTEPIHYEWYYEAENGDAFKIAQSYSSALHLSNLQHNQTGWYRCGANNLVNSQQSDPIWVDVIYSPVNSSHCSMEAVSNHSSLRLVCLWAGGYPTPKLSWSSDLNLTQQEETDTHLVKNTAIFEASDDNTSNNSSFTCRGTHPAVTQPAECSVHTYVPTEDLQCFFSVNGLNVTLSCLWEGGVPRALVWWDGPGGHSKPGQEGSNNMTIRYGTLRTEMPYTCHARHPLLTLSKTCNITLVAVSRPSLLLSEASPLEGSSISMICKVQNGTGPIHYEWYYEAENGDAFKIAQSYSSALHLSSLQHNQTGWYRCGANNLVNSQQSDPIWVDVIYSPMNSSHCFMEAVSNHSSLRMVCLWAGGYPTPKLSWSSDLNLTQQEETETHLVKNMAIFVASDNNTSNNSSFTCRGTHPAVTQPAECSVHIYVPHEELQCFFSVNGLNVTLSCLWEGGVPRALVWWDGPGGHSKPGQEGSNNMTIRYGTLRTEMPYTCHARHPLLTLSKTCNITMVAVSRPSLLLSEASPLEGSSISMICKVQNGTEPIHYEWYYEAENGDAFKIAQSYSSALHLSSLQHNQTGWYRCGANNLVNSQQSDPIWVDVIYSPMNSSICSMEAVSNHSSLRLVCLWAGGYPTPKLSWSSDLNLTQQEETDTHLVKNTAIFEASDNNTSNNSSFTCRGTHPAVTQPVECSVHTYVPTEKLQCFFNVNGLNVTLSCLWEGGVPKALVWWDGPGGHSKSGQEGSNNMTIRYGTLRTEMPYTCHARHPLLSQSKTCKITMAPLSKPNLVMSNAYPLEGSTVSMHCSVQSGTEPIQFMWHYHAVSGNTSKFAQNTSVVKLTVKRSDMGLYRCLVQNPVNNIQSDWTLLNVTYGPEFPEISLTPNTVEERGYIALEQETVSLLCQAKSNPPSQYIWFYNNSQVNSGPQFTLKDILRTQTGDYTCLAQNSFLNTRSKKSVSLTVYYPPDGLPTCSVEGTLEHTSLKLLCIWPGGFPSPKLIWSGELVDQEGVNPNTNTATLLYTQGTASNNSLFKCQGSHMALKQPAECSVQPYSPAGEPQCSAYVTSNNQNLMLSCSWDGGFPKALVWWEGPGVQGKGGQEASNILILRYGTVPNEQPYVCYARHPLVAKTKTCTVPLEPPVLQTQRRTVTVFEGTDVQLTCSLMDNNLPSNEITWFNNRGVGVMDTSKYLLLRSSAWANLTVRDTDEIQDSGQYRCTTSNAVGGTEINVTLVVKRHPMPPNASLVSVVYNSPQRNQVDLEWQVHNEEEYKGGWTGFILEYSWMFEKPGRRGGKNESIIVLHPEKIASIWYSSIIQDPDQRTHTLGSLTPTITYQFRITSINHRTLGHPSAPKSPAEPRQNSLPAIIGAAIGGMLFAAILTALLLMYIIRNRNNNPRLHDLLFGRQHSQSRENINFPEDEVMGSAGGIEDIGGLSSSGPTMALPRAASPLTVPSQSATPSTGQPPSDPAFDDGNEPVNVTITVKAT